MGKGYAVGRPPTATLHSQSHSYLILQSYLHFFFFFFAEMTVLKSDPHLSMGSQCMALHILVLPSIPALQERCTSQ